MLTRVSPDLPTAIASILREAPPAVDRVGHLERQVAELVDQNYRLMEAIQAWSDTLNRDGALDIFQARITASHGISFPATQNASSDLNTLDDYEEATNWTPVASYTTVGTSTWAPTVQVGDATKIGRDVFATFRYAGVPTNGTGAGNLQITGLPYTPSSDTNFIWDGVCVFGGLTLTGAHADVKCSLIAGSPTIVFSMTGTAVAPAVVTVADVPTGGNVVLRGTLRYRV